MDEILSAWAVERPDLVTDPMQIWSRINRLAVYFDVARRRAYARHGLESGEFDVLAALRRSGSPYRLTPGQLLRQTHVTSGTMTNRIDRLVDKGLVSRASHPEDGRGVLVELTDRGREQVDAALSSLIETEAELLAEIAPEDRRRLTQSLRVLLVALVGEAEA